MSGNLKKTVALILGFLIVFVALFILFFSVSGFKENTETKTRLEDSDKGQTTSNEPQVVNKVITLPDKGNEKTDISIQRKKINIYIIDEKGDNTLPLVSFVSPDSFSPKTVAEAVILALGERAADTSIGEVKTEESSVHIDLKTEKPDFPFGEVSEKAEEMILDCISYSILDNFGDFNTIYFTVNGEAYQSNNLKLNKDKPFINQ